MKKETIGIIGKGFVGNAIEQGFEKDYLVKSYDIDPEKTTHIFSEVIESDYVFICVPTPMENAEGGKADLTLLEDVCYQIAHTEVDDEHTVHILKSTIPIGTTDYLSKKFGFPHLIHSPEFLTERNSFWDFNNPNRHVIGGESHYAVTTLQHLYQCRFPHVPVYIMSSKEAEHVKYMSNAFLATKLMFFNEQRLLSDKMGTDWFNIVQGVIADPRIGHSHCEVPGDDGDVGFGGKCFPKDINSLISVMEEFGIDPIVIKAVWDQNKRIRKNWDWRNIKGAVS